MTTENHLDRLLAVFELLRSVDPHMPIQTAHLFVAISLRPRLSAEELSRLIQMSTSACSRNIKLLGKGVARDKPGLGLVASRRDDRDGRKIVVRPTPKGRELCQEISRALDKLALRQMPEPMSSEQQSH